MTGTPRCLYCEEVSNDIPVESFHCQKQYEAYPENYNGCHESFATLVDLNLHRANTGGCRWPENVPGMLLDANSGLWFREVDNG